MIELLTVFVTPSLSLIGVIVVGVLTYKGSKKTAEKEHALQSRIHELEKVQVNAQAFTQAKDFYLEMIETLRAELTSVRTRAEALDKELAEEKEISDNLRDEVEKLTDAIEKLEAQLAAARLRVSSLDA